MNLKSRLTGGGGGVATTNDSDSGRTPSDHEKAIGYGKHLSHTDLPPDPDEHLSPEEKAAIVSQPCSPLPISSVYTRKFTKLTYSTSSAQFKLSTKSLSDPSNIRIAGSSGS